MVQICYLAQQLDKLRLLLVAAPWLHPHLQHMQHGRRTPRSRPQLQVKGQHGGRLLGVLRRGCCRLQLLLRHSQHLLKLCC